MEKRVLRFGREKEGLHKSMINSQDYPEKSPEWTLAKFFEAWEKRDYKAMVRHCQLTWQVKHKLPIPDDREKILIFQFNQKLLNAKTLKTEKISDVTRDISVEIHYKDINIKKRIRRKVRLICELAPMKPSIEGTWGVNPLSMMRAR